MTTKILAGLIAIALMLAYLMPLVLKMKDFPLGAVIVVGVGTMLLDLWQSLDSRED